MAPRSSLLVALAAASALSLMVGCDPPPPPPKPEAPPAPPAVKPEAPTTPPQEMPQTAAREVAEPAAPTPGRIDAAFLQGAIEHAGLQRMELSVRADGTIDEIEVYHQDAAKIPAPVLARLEEVYPGAKILAYETELEADDPTPVYEVEVQTKDKKTCELEARADGAVVYTECVQAAKKVSKEIQAVLDKRLPGAKIVEIEVTEPASGERAIEVKVEWKGERHVLEFEGAEERMSRHAREVPATVSIAVP